MALSSQPINVQFSFLENKYMPFLKKNKDLTDKFQGQPLNELISIPHDNFIGIPLKKSKIPVIVQKIYDKLVEQKDLISLKNSELFFFVYSLSKLEYNIILFHVFLFKTEISNEDKDMWENFYGIQSDACCKKHYSRLITSPNEISDPLKNDPDELSTVDLDLALKQCVFKKPYVKCNLIVLSHLFNSDENVVKLFKNTYMNIPIESQFKLSDKAFLSKFNYGGIEDCSSLTCDQLYDKISFETINGETREHNVKNFLSDSLHTCFYINQGIECFPLGLPLQISENEQRLLYISIYI